jgi:hypothetical protein
LKSFERRSGEALNLSKPKYQLGNFSEYNREILKRKRRKKEIFDKGNEGVYQHLKLKTL